MKILPLMMCRVPLVPDWRKKKMMSLMLNQIPLSPGQTTPACSALRPLWWYYWPSPGPAANGLEGDRDMDGTHVEDDLHKKQHHHDLNWAGGNNTTMTAILGVICDSRTASEER